MSANELSWRRTCLLWAPEPGQLHEGHRGLTGVCWVVTVRAGGEDFYCAEVLALSIVPLLRFAPSSVQTQLHNWDVINLDTEFALPRISLLHMGLHILAHLRVPDGFHSYYSQWHLYLEHHQLDPGHHCPMLTGPHAIRKRAGEGLGKGAFPNSMPHFLTEHLEFMKYCIHAENT